MTWIARLARRLRLLTRLDSAERSMAREMRAHIEFETEQHIRAGLDPAAARAAALRDFGGIEAVKEAGRDARGTRIAEDFARDLVHATRMFTHERAFTTSAVLTFALGIGAATAIFSVVYGVLLRPLPYAQPEQLVALWEHNLARNNDRNVVSVTNFEAWRSRAMSFTDMAALVPAPMTLPAPDGPERVVGAEVSPGYFRLLGVRPMLGRDFDERDTATSGGVILSETYWRTRMGADPQVIGRLLHIGGRPHEAQNAREIIGVMPAEFEAPAFGWLGQQALWIPFVPGPENRWYGRYLLVVARLGPGASAETARAELLAVAAQLEKEDQANEGWSATLVPLAAQITGDVRPAFTYILGTVALLFALAITNVATLLLARTRRRMHEFGLRRALGATDARVHRQVITECLLLGVAGSVAGVAAAFPLVDALVALMPPEVPRVAGIRVDTTVLIASSLAALAASLGVGLVAALRGRQAPSGLLRDGAGRGSARAGGRALVVTEVAIGLIVAVFAGLVVRSFVSLQAVELGFDPRGVAVGRVALGTEYTTPASQVAFFEELVARIRQQPGVEHAGIVNSRPIRGGGPATSVRDAGATLSPTDVIADVRWADPEALRALRIPLAAGAHFDGTDRLDSPVRVVINESMARALWPEQNAVGRVAAIEFNGGLRATVVGVVRDVRLAGARTEPRPALYFAPGRFGGEAYDVVVRSDAAPPVVIAGIRAALAGMDPDTPLHRIETMDGVVSDALARDRFTAILLAAFAALALALASVGIYGVFAGDVATRRKEIGIRIALGARSKQVLSEVMGRALTSAVTGIVLGAAAALLLARSMQTMLFGVASTDAWTFLTAGASLLLVTLAATLIPAVQAARVSPLMILRGE